ncbi:Aste57867_12660 [Aphanomyces stellatus]|uniref:Aste57867_12660 protein n=1 Tax=Aphanomyces stellatus TaxID=120398 RepID=A0A485KWI6_9STRA|nr:hypothetical protein As57867_012614 [Aphanomyces stellatus]VFT89510.1 Aste57867_12660 [Aphanomyces stellatus]
MESRSPHSHKSHWNAVFGQYALVTRPGGGNSDDRPEEILPQAVFDIFYKMTNKWDPNTVSCDPEGMALFAHAKICMAAIGTRLALPLEWLWRLPLPHNLAVNHARDALQANMAIFIQACSAVLNDPTVDIESLDLCLLDYLVVSSIEHGTLSEDELVDQMLAFLIASIDATSNAITTLLNHVAHDLQVEATLRAELQTAFPGGKDTITSADALDQCTYLDWVVKESMREAPFAPAVTRSCVEACTIQRYAFKVGDTVFAHSAAASQDVDNFGAGETDLDQSCPDRHAELKC